MIAELHVHLGARPQAAPQVQRHKRRPSQRPARILVLARRLAGVQKASPHQNQGQDARHERHGIRRVAHVPERVSSKNHY